MWFLIGLILGAMVGFLIPSIALRDVCVEFEQLQQRLYELEARDALMQQWDRQRVDLWVRKNPTHHNRLPEPSRN